LRAVFFLFTGTPVPEWLFNTTKLIGDLTIPLLLFTLGVSLTQLKLGQLRVPVVWSLVRLAMGFGVGVALVSLLHFTRPAAAVVILQCSMPAAVFSYLFAKVI